MARICRGSQHSRASINAVLREAIWVRKLVPFHDAHDILEIGFVINADPLGPATNAASKAALAIHLTTHLSRESYATLMAPFAGHLQSLGESISPTERD
jgi:hypothetical protein